MAKRGKHWGFATARVNANVENRGIIADALALREEQWMAEGSEITDPQCAGGCCPCCGCTCPPFAAFAVAFNAKNGKTTNTVRR